MAEFHVIEEGAFSDYEFQASAATLEELFAICGVATFDAITDVQKIEASAKIKFKVAAENIEDLLYAFLAELIYIKDTQKIFLSKFEIEIKEGYALKCQAFGEYIDRNKHDFKTDVKAVTYHHLKIEKTDEGYSAHVILDL